MAQQQHQSEHDRISALEAQVAALVRLQASPTAQAPLPRSGKMALDDTDLALHEQTLGLLRTLHWRRVIAPPEQIAAYSPGDIGATPVGTPQDQCWQFTLNDPRILGTDDATAAPAGAGCVGLQSAAVQNGSATFVICCVKDAAGKCTNCTDIVTLSVTRGVPARLIASMNVRLVCAPPP
jgi:hypothetical protein